MGASEILHLINRGWYVTYPLGVLSVIVFAIAFERLWKYRGLEAATREMTRKLVDHLLKRDLAAARALCEASTTPMSAVFAEGLRWGNFAVEDVQQILATARQEFLTDLKRGVWFVGTIGSLAPYIGLLGTVIGIIKAFQSISASKGGGPEVVAGGVAEALITTAFGLFVAIPAVMGYNYLVHRVQRLALEVQVSVSEIIDRISKRK
jgi:biopolymer transport protein ExbB